MYVCVSSTVFMQKYFPLSSKTKYVGADGCRHVHGMQYLVTVPTVPMAGHLQLVAYQIRMWEQMDAGTSMGCNICSLFQLFRIFNVRSDQESLGQNYNNNQQS